MRWVLVYFEDGVLQSEKDLDSFIARLEMLVTKTANAMERLLLGNHRCGKLEIRSIFPQEDAREYTPVRIPSAHSTATVPTLRQTCFPPAFEQFLLLSVRNFGMPAR
jgi:hypothetical protein